MGSNPTIKLQTGLQAVCKSCRPVCKRSAKVADRSASGLQKLQTGLQGGSKSCSSHRAGGGRTNASLPTPAAKANHRAK